MSVILNPTSFVIEPEKIDIYDSPQDKAFNCIIVKDKMVLSIVSNLDLEAFLDIVQEINYE